VGAGLLVIVGLGKTFAVVTIGVAAFLMGPLAHTAELTLYGIIDTGLSVGKVSRDDIGSAGALNASNAGMTTGVLVGGSRWGMRGSETLSPEWRTEFVLESGINSTNGQFEQAGRGFGRQTTLSLERINLVKLDFGRQMNLASRYFLAMNPFRSATSQLAIGTSFGNAKVIRYSNLVQAQLLPTENLKIGLSYSFNAQLPAVYANSDGNLVPAGSNEAGFGTSQKLRVVSAGMHYERGGLVLAAGYDKAIAPATTVTGLNYKGPSAWLVGASYDFKLATVSLIVGESSNGAFDGQLPGTEWADSGLTTTTDNTSIRFQDGYDSQSVFLGFLVPLPQRWTASFTWQAMQPVGPLGASDQTATQQVFSLAFLNAISTRLTAYVYASIANNYAMVRTARSQVAGMGLAYTF
jgi:general bacterial porin, GBP family